MSSSGYSCVRYIFCWLNVFLWIAGCGILGVGIWLRIAYEGYTSLMPQYALLSADSLAIAVGVIMISLSFFACCGSWFQNRCMLITYFSFIVFVFVAEFLIGSLAFVYREPLGHTLKLELQNGIMHHYNVTATGQNSLVTIWDHIQTEFRCCGVEDYSDWFQIDAWRTRNWTPDTCCLPATAKLDCGKSETVVDHVYPHGCYKQIHDYFIGRLHIVGVVGLTIAFIQLYGLISSMLLFCTMKYKRTSRTYKSYHS